MIDTNVQYSLALLEVGNLTPSLMVADVCAKRTVLPTVDPATAAAPMGWRTDGTGGAAACGTVPPSLKAHSESPPVVLYSRPWPPESTATYCTPLIE